MLPRNYASTNNKELVRKEDTNLIRKEFRRKGRKLSYLGMPSGEMRDILTWKDYIKRCTAIEIDDEQRQELVLNALRNNLYDKIKILFGDIEEILVKSKDKFNNKLEFPYDIVFLDFFGTILYKELRRVKAIRCLIEKQKGHSFLLLLTFNLKEKRYSKHAVKNTISKIKRDLLSYYIYDDSLRKHISYILDQYKSDDTGEVYKQKLFVPYFIKSTAEKSGFKTHAYSPIFYLGFKNNPMIHFSFKLTSEPDSPTQAISKQGLIDIVNINIKKADKGRISVMCEQMPRL